jgi:hypothetical protein
VGIVTARRKRARRIPLPTKRLRDRQDLFARLFPLLLLYMDTLGVNVRASLGQVERSEQDAARLGFRRSLHRLKLAGDVNLFLIRHDGSEEYITDSRVHNRAGALWKALHPLCRWGGDFRKKDYNHYSIAWGNRA